MATRRKSAGSIHNTVLLCVCFIALVLGALVYSVLRDPVPSLEMLREQGTFILPRPRELAPFALVDIDGKTFDNASLVGHWTFLFFGFTQCPDVCPVTLSVLGQAERRFKAQSPEAAARIRTALVSVDPERDDRETLATYVRAFSESLTGVTGDRDSLASFARQVNVAFAKVPSDGGYTMDHTGNVVVINPKGHYHGFIKLPHTVDKVLTAYQALAAES